MHQPTVKTALKTIAALWLSGFLQYQLSAQALPPTHDPQSNDTGCLGPSKLLREDGVQFETFMTSAIELSVKAKTAKLPLFQGLDANNNPVYYILTESSDCDEARTRNLNYAPKLGFLIDANGNPKNAAVQKVTFVGNQGAIKFQGTADFSPVRIFTPSSPDGWPPAASTAGSKGDSLYTPFITYKNAKGKYVVLNASQVKNNSGIKDFVPEIDTVNMTATFNLVMGIYDFNFVMYLRMDASDDVISGFEGGIFAPNPGLAGTNGDRFFADKSARQVIIPVLNGIRGTDQIYDRQGLQSAALGEGDPLNVMGAKPGDIEYSPIWDITPVVWTVLNKRQRLHQDDEVEAFFRAGYLTSLPGAPGAINSDLGIKSLNIVSNCPIMLRVIKGLLPYQPAPSDPAN